MARAYPRGPTAEEEQRNLEAFSRFAERAFPPLVSAVDVFPICDWCVRGTPERTLPITRKVMGSDERVPVFVCQRCYRLWTELPRWRRIWLRIVDWWNR